MSMNIASLAGNAAAKPIVAPQIKGSDDGEVRRAFDQFVGETFYGQMLKSMRETVGKPAYFHGGKAEEAFTTQLDQVLSEQLTKASANSFTGPMFELFNLQRS